MDHLKPQDVVKAMLASGRAKGALPRRDLLLRGFLSGAILGCATSLAMTAAQQTAPIVGALVFPVGFIMIVLLQLELVTGNFAVVSLAAVDGAYPWRTACINFFWVYVANLAGALAYGALLAVALKGGHVFPVAERIVAAAEAKTIAYSAHGAAGMASVIAKSILCNWMVCMAVVLAFTSQSTIGKIAAAWLPVLTFFGQGFEHTVVNMFVIPTGMMLGAHVSFTDWWLWNQIPSTLGNFVGGFVFTGLFLYWTYRTPPATSGATIETVIISQSPAQNNAQKSPAPAHDSRS